MTKRYEHIAEHLSGQIRAGVLRPGERMPSVREARHAYHASVGTVTKAYRLLEDRGDIAARPRSGYYVAERPRTQLREPSLTQPGRTSAPLSTNDLLYDLLATTKAPNIVPFGSAFMDPHFFPLARLAQDLGRAAKRLQPSLLTDYLPPGHIELRRAIARRYLKAGCDVRPEEIMITAGALEALNLCLRTVARPGDLIAVETPTFYAALRAIERLGMKPLEVPTHAREGIDLGALASALKRGSVKACWLMPTFQNPLGCLMPEDKKRDLVRLLARHAVPLIEDDVYEELYFGAKRPRPAKAFDKAGLVLHCSSVTKSLAPGYRIGWISAGRFAARIERDKWITNLTTNMPAQAAIAQYLRHGGFDHHLRKLRTLLERQRDKMAEALTDYLPRDSRITRPEGGYFVWVELGRQIDSEEVYRSCLAAGISVAPGPLFTGQRDKYRNCLRLNYGHPWSPRMRNAVATLSEIVRTGIGRRRHREDS